MSTSEKPTHSSQPAAPSDSPADADPHQQMPEALDDPQAILSGRIQELEAQQADLTDRLLRAHADMENLRKRAEREKSDSAKYAITKFAHDIVGIADNFQRAVVAVPAGEAEQDGPLKSVIEGVLMTERAFLQVLERHGVRRIDPKGEPFDPNQHQAVMEQEDAGVPAGTVLQVFQLGYKIEDRVLRPAMVVVSRGGAKAAKSAEPTRAAGDPPGAGNDNGSAGG
jgi:molecular chaperone GrpE